jgi:ATP-dependent 26S proteasome regulatory subunit
MSDIKNKSFIRDLIDNIRAGSSLIYVVTDDESEAIKHVRRIVSSLHLFYKSASKKRKIGYYEWDCINGATQGLLGDVAKEDHYQNYISDKKDERESFIFAEKTEVEGSREILKALEFFSAKHNKSKDNAVNAQVVVLKDLHSSLKDPKIIRRLKNIALSNNDDDNDIRKCIIVMSPVKHIPVELNNLINVIEWKLPMTNDIVEFLKYSSFITDIIEDAEASKLKKPDGTRFVYSKTELSDICRALSGLSFPEIENVAAISNSRYGEIVPHFLMEQKKQLIIKQGMLEYHDPKVGMSEIGGLECLKEWMTIRKKAFSEKAEQFGIEAPKGVLLVGIQGCGKSHMAKAIAHLLGLPLVRFDVGKVFSKTVGSSEENIRNIISLVEAVAPCVLMIDEIEKGLAGVQSSNASDGGTTARVIGTLLSWLNDKTSQVFVVATANNVRQLPPELQRKGRFDEIFFVPLPEKTEREEIFKIHIEKRGRKASDYNIPLLAEISDKFSGAECEEAVKSALILAFDKDEELQNKHLTMAIKELIPLWKTCQEDLEYLYQWVGWDKEKNDGIRARYSSAARKDVASQQGNNAIPFKKDK